ncbi:MAG: carbohydrate-binding protein, partial [Clostridia bacterium]|nr:carbohydrate-binding protein [Clostridia bacterium]
MSTGHDKYIPAGTIDNIINDEIINRWSGYGAGAFLVYDLGYKQNIHSFGLAVLNGLTRQTLFSVSISDDGET